MTKRKFYKSVFKIVVLSQDPLPEQIGLDWIQYEITEGHCSGHLLPYSEKEINGKTAAKELMKQASDPSFFNLTEDGEDLCED